MRTGTERRRKWKTVTPLTQQNWRSNARGDSMGLVKARTLAAMQKQQRAKALVVSLLVVGGWWEKD